MSTKKLFDSLSPERVLMILAVSAMTFALASQSMGFFMKVFIFIITFTILIFTILSEAKFFEKWTGPPEGAEFSEA